ncbi:hypothetical protein ACUTJJ_05370 [Agrobacterium sp. DKPNP3]|uniref:hypothetical protein n=1 Tax=Agrobacterium sp. DKPNP3 TaxID=3457323 RepID=UPI0040443F8C
MGDTYVRVSGVARKVADAYRKVGGVWVPATELHTVVPALKQSRQVFNAEVIVSAQATGLQNIRDIFNTAQTGLWASTKRKRLLVNQSRGPLLIDSDFGGELTIEVVAGGIISGNGGAGSNSLGIAGAAGGAAINVASSVTRKALLINNGIIRGGGGGGGKGGTGGQGGGGAYGYTAQEGPAYDQNSYRFALTYYYNNYNGAVSYVGGDVYWGGGLIGGVGENQTAIGNVGFTYYRHSFVTSRLLGQDSNGSYTQSLFQVYRQWTAMAYTSGGAGGAGGNGGRGIGWDGARANGAGGAGGAAGGQNAGTGGTGGVGGNGGDWGAAASNAAVGNTGGAGNNGGGAGGGAGSASGAGGRAVLGYSRLHYEGSGSLIGGTV